MTYFGFLGIFLCLPLLIVSFLLWNFIRRGGQLPQIFQTWPARWVILGHVLVAVFYTTPWDNYLVATRVWWYDPQLVSGIVLGYVPLEEYTFFILQTILTGLWVVFLMVQQQPTLDRQRFVPRDGYRWWSTAAVAAVWLLSTVVLFSGWRPATYMTLILSWALIPVLLQLAVGADILWHFRKLVMLGIWVPTLFLAAADALAISAGTWTISPELTFNLLIGGILPLEEFIFFLMTNVLVTFGVTLVLARPSHQRAARFLPQKVTI